MNTAAIKRMELNMDELESILQRARVSPLDEADCAKIKVVFESYLYVTDLLEDKRTTLDRLRKLLFGSGSEKTREVLKDKDQGASSTTAPDGDESPQTADSEQETTTPPKGHGRNGADDYEGAERVPVSHTSLRSGDPCPECKKGTVYEQAEPGVLVRITGQAPLHAKVYELQKLRCNLCGKVFTAEPPEGAVGDEKYDATAGSMIALLKYGTGLPFNRLEGLQGNLGIPLPASTQWDLVQAAAGTVEPAYEELIRQAAQGEVLHNDDTTIKILEFMGKRARQEASSEVGEPADNSSDHPAKGQGERRGLFTSGIVSTREGRRIALFFSGRRHAGENLADVLARRAEDLTPPIQMCDALSRNVPAAFKTILANCLAHGRRQFVDVAERFPEECRYVLEALGEVYRNDAVTREQNLSPEQRLAFHQAESGPVMEQLQAWCTRQFEERLVEPNSALGQAISYLLKHWEKLTLFLRKPGAPLDNNICERALKLAIRHRKNALFYRSQNGAHVGDVFMSLIHTCQLNDVDPFGYLTELQRHAADLAAQPENWMPWNYRESLAATRGC
jgi:transposase